VLCDEITQQPPAESAEGWVNNLLMQLELDGFDGYGKCIGGWVEPDTASEKSNAQLSHACRSFCTHVKGLPTN
jgi:hypothetical protein